MLLTAPAVAATKTATPDVKSWQLPNKLRVVFVPDHKAPVVTVQVFYHAGGKDEPADKRGIAHMFEHMMFKGSKFVRPEEHARFIDAVGGNENAFTQDDATGYHDTIPPAALDFTLKLEAERMRNLELTQKTIDSEREVVKEELRVRLENNPVMKALDKVLHLAYTVHPYRQFPIGEKKMLDSVTVEDCKKFYDTYYRPNNATLIVVGDTDEKTVRALVQKHFAPLEAGPEPPRPSKAKEEPLQNALREATLSIPVQLPFVVGAYHIAAGESEDMYALEVLQQILSGGESSRMYQRLVRKDKVAVFAGGQTFEHEEPGLFLTFAAFLPGGDPIKVRAALEDELQKIVDAPVEASELAKAKNQLAARAVFRRERVSEIATQIGIDGIVAHDPMRGFSAPAKYDAITAAEVQRVAKKYLTKNNESIVILQPLGKPAAATKPAPAPAPAQPQSKGGQK
ncbi:MAG: M16 family metallopeptidase [Ilumatobacteraceae bacterium]